MRHSNRINFFLQLSILLFHEGVELRNLFGDCFSFLEDSCMVLDNGFLGRHTFKFALDFVKVG